MKVKYCMQVTSDNIIMMLKQLVCNNATCLQQQQPLAGTTVIVLSVIMYSAVACGQGYMYTGYDVQSPTTVVHIGALCRVAY